MQAVFEPLSDFHQLFRLSWQQALERYKSSDLAFDLADWPTQRANVLFSLAVNYFENETMGWDSVRVRPYKKQTKHFLLRGNDEKWYSIRFKNTDMAGRSHSIPTRNSSHYLQLPVFGEGHFETLEANTRQREQYNFTVGYVLDLTGMAFETILLSWEARDIVEEIPASVESNVTALSFNTDNDRTPQIDTGETDDDEFEQQNEGGTEFQ